MYIYICASNHYIMATVFSHPTSSIPESNIRSQLPLLGNAPHLLHTLGDPRCFRCFGRSNDVLDPQLIHPTTSG